ncbi:hypothetical protein [Streptomyces sp. YIM B13518]|uniref:hypothetical protein n=1 Tax=Streptomyces sp. YIM B13518 TaxID=3366316 RepID=UPI0036A78A6E
MTRGGAAVRSATDDTDDTAADGGPDLARPAEGTAPVAPGQLVTVRNRPWVVTEVTRSALTTDLAPHCEYRLFLSATPHSGYLESFTALLELLDDHRFARGVKPTDEQLRRVMVRRLKSELPRTWNDKPRFPQRVPHALEVRYGDETRAAYAKLAEYARSRREGNDGGKAGGTAADFVTTLLKKRFLSSPKAFAETIATHLETMTSKRPADEAAPAPPPSSPTA